MGSRDNICREKLDIQNGLPENSVLYLNGDNDMIRKHIGYVTHPYEFFGFSEDCSYRAEGTEEIHGQTHFTFVHENMKEPVILNVLGDHNVSNALAAIALGLASMRFRWKRSNGSLPHSPDSARISLKYTGTRSLMTPTMPAPIP